MIEFANSKIDVIYEVPESVYKRSLGAKLKRTSSVTWNVMSDEGEKHYTVTYDGKFKCSCPYHQKKNKLCKHIAAVMRSAEKAQVKII